MIVLVEVGGQLYAVRTADPQAVLDRCRAEGLRAELEDGVAAGCGAAPAAGVLARGASRRPVNPRRKPASSPGRTNPRLGFSSSGRSPPPAFPRRADETAACRMQPRSKQPGHEGGIDL